MFTNKTRFYEVDKGHILFNGKDIKDINIYSYRKHLSLVAQEPTLFQGASPRLLLPPTDNPGTIRENILLGVDPTAITDEDLHQACMDASIHEFISSLPEGYNTPIGSRGVSLSGGQKQRVSIARALIRKPDVLLLDEATSSLDSESEKLVQAAFERAGQGRTMVVVAHRLATVQNADVIFVLGDGALLERGNHAELLKKKGVYWQMVSHLPQSQMGTLLTRCSAKAKPSTDNAGDVVLFLLYIFSPSYPRARHLRISLCWNHTSIRIGQEHFPHVPTIDTPDSTL